MKKRKHQVQVRDQVNLHCVDRNDSDIEQDSPRKESELS